MKNIKLSLIMLFTIYIGSMNSFADELVEHGLKHNKYKGTFFEADLPQSVYLNLGDLEIGSSDSHILEFYKPRGCHLSMEYSTFKDNTYYFYINDRYKHSYFWCKDFIKSEGTKYLKLTVTDKNEAVYQLFNNKTLVEEHTLTPYYEK